jgi:hypothetical protein
MYQSNQVRFLSLSLFTAVILLPGCSSRGGLQLQPDRLKNPSGWKEVTAGGGINFIGQFVLKKGESTDNGKIGVKVLDLLSKPCPTFTICSEPEAKAVLRFYRPSDQTVLCDLILEASDTSFSTSQMCNGELPFTNLEVREINTKEGWALISFFNLAKDEQKK